MHRIFVIVRNGEAEVRSDTVPHEMKVEVIDLDVIQQGESFPSREAFEYCKDHHIFEDRRKRPGSQRGGERASDPETDNAA